MNPVTTAPATCPSVCEDYPEVAGELMVAHVNIGVAAGAQLARLLLQCCQRQDASGQPQRTLGQACISAAKFVLNATIVGTAATAVSFYSMAGSRNPQALPAAAMGAAGAVGAGLALGAASQVFSQVVGCCRFLCSDEDEEPDQELQQRAVQAVAVPNDPNYNPNDWYPNSQYVNTVT